MYFPRLRIHVESTGLIHNNSKTVMKAPCLKFNLGETPSTCQTQGVTRSCATHVQSACDTCAICMRHACDTRAICMRQHMQSACDTRVIRTQTVCDMCATCVRHVCDTHAICMRHVCDMHVIASSADRLTYACSAPKNV